MKPILLIFDTKGAVTKSFLEACLSKLNYQYKTVELNAKDMKNASKLIREVPDYKALIVDITSSDSLAWRLVEEMRQTLKEKTIPIILTVVYSRDVVGENYEMWKKYMYSFDDYLQKPIDVNNLKTMLSRIFEEQ